MLSRWQSGLAVCRTGKRDVQAKGPGAGVLLEHRDAGAVLEGRSVRAPISS